MAGTGSTLDRAERAGERDVAPAPAVRTRRPPVVLQGVLVALASLALGAATSWMQVLLPDSSLANSSSAWTALTVLLVVLCGRRWIPSAIFGAVSLVALVLGYQWTLNLRGIPDSEEVFLAIGVLVGPFVGVAASWLRFRDLRGVVGAGLLGGIGIGELLYTEVELGGSADQAYWAVAGLVSAALVAIVGTRLRSARLRLLLVALVAAVAPAFCLAYTLAGTIPG